MHLIHGVPCLDFQKCTTIVDYNGQAVYYKLWMLHFGFCSLIEKGLTVLGPRSTDGWFRTFSNRPAENSKIRQASNFCHYYQMFFFSDSLQVNMIFVSGCIRELKYTLKSASHRPQLYRDKWLLRQHRRAPLRSCATQNAFENCHSSILAWNRRLLFEIRIFIYFIEKIRCSSFVFLQTHLFNPHFQGK